MHKMEIGMNNDLIPQDRGETRTADHQNSIRTTLGILPVFAISAGLASGAYAQEANNGTITLDTIHLNIGTEAATGYKVSEGSSDKLTAPLLDTPRTVTVVTEKVIEERGATSLDDILRTTPGVTLGTGEGGTPFGTRPYIRGFEASTDISIDGIRSLGRATYESFNLESVEINMGADGVASGRGSTGGNINLVTKTAREGETFHEVTGTIGTDDQYRATYDGNFDLGNGFAARLNLMYQDSDVPGRDFATDQREGVAVSVLKNFGNGTRLSFGASRVNGDGMPDYGVPMANSGYVSGTGDTSYGTGTESDPYQPLEVMDSSNFYGSAVRDFRESTNDTFTLKLEHEFSNNFRMTSTLAYIGTDQDYAVTRPSLSGTSTVVRNLRGYVRDNNSTAFVTNFSGEFNTGDIEHSLSFGVELTHEKLRTASYSGGAVDSTDLYNPDPYTALTSVLERGDFGEPTVTDTRSIYVFDTMKLNEQWYVNAGIRLERYDLETETYDRKDDLTNYQIGVIYKPLPNASIYASFNTSSAPAGECAGQAGNSGGACSTLDTADDGSPEESENFQIGTKWDIYGGRMALTAAIFQTEKTNQRVQNVDGEYELLGSSRSRGLELGAAGQINDRWAIMAGYTYLDAELTDDGPASSNDGNKLINTAEHTFGLWTTYAVNNQWIVGGGANYVSEKFVTTANTSSVPAYWRIDLMTSYEINEKTSLQLNINNLFDEEIYDSSHQGLFATMQPGRNATLKLTHRM
jgi:catecholate siderophore receptor